MAQSSFLPAESSPTTSPMKKSREKAARETVQRPAHEAPARPAATAKAQPKHYRVRDVIATLQNFNPDAVLVLSCDPEGNQFSPLFEVSPVSGRIEKDRHRVLFEVTGDAPDKSADALVFYPTS